MIEEMEIELGEEQEGSFTLLKDKLSTIISLPY